MSTQLKMLCKYLTMILFVFALVTPADMNAATVDQKKEQKKQPKKQPKKKDKKKDKKEPSIPLDGGLSLLVLGAAAFGVRKLRKTK